MQAISNSKKMTDPEIKRLRTGDPVRVLFETDKPAQEATFESFSAGSEGQVEQVGVRVNHSAFGLREVHPSRVCHPTPADIIDHNIRTLDEWTARDIGKKIANAHHRARAMMAGRFDARLRRMGRPINRVDQLLSIMQEAKRAELARLAALAREADIADNHGQVAYKGDAKVFPAGTTFVVTVSNVPKWLEPAAYGPSYGIIELCKGQFIQSWGPYNGLAEAFEAQEHLSAQVAQEVK